MATRPVVDAFHALVPALIRPLCASLIARH
jgi:hypothetical protein